jgi:hypothetical protein
VWHQWNKKCSTFAQILDGIIMIWWKFAEMDENDQIGWKIVKLDERFGYKKMIFWKKIAKFSIFWKKIHHLAIFC